MKKNLQFGIVMIVLVLLTGVLMYQVYTSPKDNSKTLYGLLYKNGEIRISFYQGNWTATVAGPLTTYSNANFTLVQQWIENYSIGDK